MITFQNVSARYSQPNGEWQTVLHAINLTVEQGEFVAIIGRNGSGKTTLARLCNGLVLPSEGTVRVGGLEISADHHSHIREIRRIVGMVFQNPENQIVSTTVEREIAFGLENLAVSRDEMHERVNDALAAFDLEKYRHRPPASLSGGEKQRLALAAVMAMQPAYLILDEPTAMLDYEHKKKFLAYVNQLSTFRSNGHAQTVILITQDPVEALFARRLIVLHAGGICLDGRPHDIFLQEDTLRAIGLAPPLEFSVFNRLKKCNGSVSSIGDLLLEPLI
jgi:energy-coupling factor transport system ATP-binding protein